MTRSRVGLSPHCVAYVAPDGAIRIVDGVAGAEYELSREAFVTLLACDAPALDRKLPRALRATPARRRVLAREGLRKTDDNPSLLDGIELACHRQLNRARMEPRAIGAETPAPAATIELPLDGEAGPPMDLVECLARRSSKRVYATAPMALLRLAKLLELACRARSLVDAPGSHASQRAYPSGGASYSLEVYPIVYNVAGLAAGAYRYDPFAHALARVDASEDGERHLLALVLDAMAGLVRGEPSAVLVITSVFARTAHTYRCNAYHLIIAEVGALYQTIYLTAERLGLAACALGQVKERWTSAWLGLDGIAEAQVGLVALGVPDDVQDVVAVDRVERRVTARLRCAGELVRLHAGAVAYTVPRDELVLVDTVATWTTRRVRFVLSPALAMELA